MAYSSRFRPSSHPTVVDEEFNRFSVEQLNEADTLLFGRVTYEGMAAYWPTPAAERDDPGVGGEDERLSIVVSRTLARAEWANTRLIGADAGEQLSKLKRQPGQEIAILGSSDT